jgi:hypothetical protein
MVPMLYLSCHSKDSPSRVRILLFLKNKKHHVILRDKEVCRLVCVPSLCYLFEIFPAARHKISLCSVYSVFISLVVDTFLRLIRYRLSNVSVSAFFLKKNF